MKTQRGHADFGFLFFWIAAIAGTIFQGGAIFFFYCAWKFWT